jgi:ribosomal protein S18 acetylase RimI-like enzyme
MKGTYIMGNIIINNKEYIFVKGNGRDNAYRKSFNTLTEKTFGFNFEQWYEGGHWKDQYLPYSLMFGEEVVSNVSVNFMNIEVFGKSKTLIQLGTVMTDEKFRNQGLNRILLDKVIADWQSECEYIFLFANDSVLDFYPKFGFHKIDQYYCSKDIRKIDKDRNAKKLDMLDVNNKELVYNIANNSYSTSQITMIGNAELIMFYCNTFMKDSVYYIPEYDTIVIANYEQDVLEILGVFGKKEVSLDTIFDYMASEDTNSVKLHFTPKEKDFYTFKPIDNEDTLFILGEDCSLLNQHCMFPALSHT